MATEFGGSSAGVTGKLDDPDQDGIANVLEFVLGGNPQVGNRAEMLQFSNDGGFLTLTYTRAISSIGLVELLPQISGDSKNWNSGGGLTVQELISSDGVFETWRVRDATPIGAGSRRFLRIHATCTDG